MKMKSADEFEKGMKKQEEIMLQQMEKDKQGKVISTDEMKKKVELTRLKEENKKLDEILKNSERKVQEIRLNVLNATGYINSAYKKLEKFEKELRGKK